MISGDSLGSDTPPAEHWVAGAASDLAREPHSFQAQPHQSLPTRLLARLLPRLEAGHVTIETPSGERLDLAAPKPGPHATIVLHRWRSLIESITSFSELPLIGIFYLGLSIFALSALAAVLLIFLRLIGRIGLAGWASVMVSLWLLGGMLIFCVGIIGIYVSRIFIETKQRPYTIVRQVHERAAGEPVS